ncbi:3-demethylubiquinone-9 3-methyltransferase [Mesorhizobium plurifarium]|uniref:3-demethylubiquinone-9 3-methyltransferase n=1 Tax=Mesorhizobium plurifarium TaxID=69974 RepID=A0A090FUY6_MESPL|nr:3-demethylubiquinone-9 3-methyltransferase [Mesorhizobium plurifarium]
MTKATPFLMFEGKAEEAMTLYCGTIPDSRVLDVTRYGAGEGGTEGTLKLARALIGGVEVRIYNSGGFLMPTGNYGFSRRFAWLNDRFGVSWQINLP